MGLFDRISSWAKRIKRDGVTLWFAGKHRDTPWYAKALGVVVVGYALSPIDLIPDFIPVLGYVDDALLLPLLIWLTIRMIPEPVLAESRLQAEAWMRDAGSKPTSRIGAAVIVIVWVAAGAGLCWWIFR